MGHEDEYHDAMIDMLELVWGEGFMAPGNRITLCAFHHQRCLHAGLLRVSGRAPDGLFFELGLRPGVSPLVRYRAGDIAIPPQRGRC